MGTSDNSEEEEWFKISLYDFNKGNLEEALKSCNQILEFNNKYVKAWVLFVIINQKMGNNSKVLEAFDNLREFNASEQDNWVEIALEFKNRENLSSALKALETSLDFKSEKKDSWIELGDSYDTIGFYEKAYTCYKKALKLDPMDMDLLYPSKPVTSCIATSG